MAAGDEASRGAPKGPRAALTPICEGRVREGTDRVAGHMGHCPLCRALALQQCAHCQCAHVSLCEVANLASTLWEGRWPYFITLRLTAALCSAVAAKLQWCRADLPNCCRQPSPLGYVKLCTTEQSGNFAIE